MTKPGRRTPLYEGGRRKIDAATTAKDIGIAITRQIENGDWKAAISSLESLLSVLEHLRQLER